MADYHLLPDKEHYEEEDVALPSIDTESDLWKLLDSINEFMTVCLIVLTSGGATLLLFYVLFFKDPASAQNISFLGAFSSQKKKPSAMNVNHR